MRSGTELRQFLRVFLPTLTFKKRNMGHTSKFRLFKPRQ